MTPSVSKTELFNGNLENERVLVNGAIPAGGYVITYSLPADFEPDVDVVVQGVSFVVGLNAAGGAWQDSEARLPCSWKVEGRSGSSGEWKLLSQVTGYKVNETTASGTHRTKMFVSQSSCREYRITVTDSQAAQAGNAYCLQLSEVRLLGFHGGTYVPPAAVPGDITDAVRRQGLSTSVSASKPDIWGQVQPEILTDGVLSRRDNWWERQSYLVETGPVDFTLTVPDEFLPGEDVVVTAVTFAVGAYNETGGTHKDYTTRFPKAWKLEGSNDGETWSILGNVTDFSYCVRRDYESYFDTYEATVDYCNWQSYRRYRLTVSAQGGASNYFLQLSEIKLWGLFGGHVVRPEPQVRDLTADARQKGNRRLLGTNVEWNDSWYPLANVFNGTCTSASTDRFLSDAASTVSILATNGVWISYEFPDAYACGGDVIVTGYTLDVNKSFGNSLNRMPRDWKFQAYDESKSAWVTLDECRNFTQWETVSVDEQDQYATTFTFANSVPYRKYRLFITAQYYHSWSIPESSRSVQLSEIRLFGYADKNIAGSVGTTGVGHPFDFVEWKRTYDANGHPFMEAPTMTLSERYEDGGTYSYGTANLLFDGDVSNRVVSCLDGYFPYYIGYAAPDTLLPGKDVIATNYAISVMKSWASVYQRMPLDWRFEAFADGRWIAIDRQKGFTGWATVTEKGTEVLKAAFAMPDNRLSARQYRFRIDAVAGTSKPYDKTVHQLQIGEIAINGVWGSDIGEPPSERKGMSVIIR